MGTKETKQIALEIMTKKGMKVNLSDFTVKQARQVIKQQNL